MMVMTATAAPSNHQSLVIQSEFYIYPDSVELLIPVIPTSEQLWQKASELERMGHYSEVLSVLDQIIELNPESFQAWHWQGNIWGSLGNYQAAIASYEQAIKLKPNYFLATFERGVVQVFQVFSRILLARE